MGNHNFKEGDVLRMKARPMYKVVFIKDDPQDNDKVIVANQTNKDESIRWISLELDNSDNDFPSVEIGTI